MNKMPPAPPIANPKRAARLIQTTHSAGMEATPFVARPLLSHASPQREQGFVCPCLRFGLKFQGQLRGNRNRVFPNEVALRALSRRAPALRRRRALATQVHHDAAKQAAPPASERGPVPVDSIFLATSAVARGWR